MLGRGEMYGLQGQAFQVALGRRGWARVGILRLAPDLKPGPKTQGKMETVRTSRARDFSGTVCWILEETKLSGHFRGAYTRLCLLGTGFTWGWSLWSFLKRQRVSSDWLICLSRFFLFLTLSTFWKIGSNQGQVNLVIDLLEFAHGLMPPTFMVVFPTYLTLSTNTLQAFPEMCFTNRLSPWNQPGWQWTSLGHWLAGCKLAAFLLHYWRLFCWSLSGWVHLLSAGWCSFACIYSPSS